MCDWSHMVVGAKVCELTEDFLWFVCGLYVGILTSPLSVGIHVGDVDFMLFVSFFCVVTQCKHGLWWNMGFKDKVPKVNNICKC